MDIFFVLELSRATNRLLFCKISRSTKDNDDGVVFELCGAVRRFHVSRGNPNIDEVV